jgi:DNA-binding XRE family transcriptional regulator
VLIERRGSLLIKIKVKAKEIKRSRILKGYSQVDAAKEVSLNPASYCLIENGKLGVKAQTAKRITIFLNKSFDELFEISDIERRDDLAKTQ